MHGPWGIRGLYIMKFQCTRKVLVQKQGRDGARGGGSHTPQARLARAHAWGECGHLGLRFLLWSVSKSSICIKNIKKYKKIRLLRTFYFHLFTYSRTNSADFGVWFLINSSRVTS